MFNQTYRKKALKVLDQIDTVGFGFKLSAPSKIAGANRKWSFSLPAGPDFTCPGATPACKDCYAQSGFHIFRNVQTSFIRNWVTFSYFESTKDIMGAAEALLSLIKVDTPVFRIHESGDFSNQFHIDVWKEVAVNRPNTKFWFYTRSFHLDYLSLLELPNVTGWASTDQYNQVQATEFANKYNIKQAWGPWSTTVEKPPNSFYCPVTTGKLAIDSGCYNCKLCITKDRTNKDVVFIGH